MSFRFCFLCGSEEHDTGDHIELEVLEELELEEELEEELELE